MYTRVSYAEKRRSEWSASAASTRPRELLGVSTTTLRRWIYAGKVRAVRTQEGHFRIPESEVKRLLGGVKEVRAAIYARVSRDQLEDLKRQVERLEDYCSAKGYRVVAT
ncbi:MAG TPA: helix-turn-helix domain-containing protein [Candidatus Korarchaeota archaeon]|nr:helix-turn-helix domain-containing protein [Candidatus Korarchaeota archaeon]